VIAAGRNAERLAKVAADATVPLVGTALTGEAARPGTGSVAEQLNEPVDLVIDPLSGPYVAESLSCLKAGGRYLNVGGAAGEATTVSADWLRASRLTLIGFSASGVDRNELLAAYARIMDLAAAGSFTLPVETYPLDDAARAWEAQAGSPGTKIFIVP
jgi:NADPH:quinone reductase